MLPGLCDTDTKKPTSLKLEKYCNPEFPTLPMCLEDDHSALYSFRSFSNLQL